MIAKGKARGLLIPFKHKKMTDKPIVIDSFYHKESPEGLQGEFFVLGFPDGSQRLAYNLWQGGERNYDLTIYLKTGAEKYVKKGEDGYAEVKGHVENLWTKETNEDLVEAIEEWMSPTDNSKKKVKDYIKAHRPKGNGNNVTQDTAIKAAHG